MNGDSPLNMYLIEYEKEKTKIGVQLTIRRIIRRQPYEQKKKVIIIREFNMYRFRVIYHRNAFIMYACMLLRVFFASSERQLMV